MSRVIVKIHYKDANGRGHGIKVGNRIQSSDKNYLEYIATRDGVDLTNLKNQKHKEMGSDESYADYITNRKRSHGLFDKDGVADLEKVKDDINNTQSTVYRMIISVEEDDAISLKLTEKEEWQKLMNRKMDDIANEIGIAPNNLEWYAAFHNEKKHPHVHVMFWEKEKTLIRNSLAKGSLTRIKKELTDYLFEKERKIYLNNKNIERDFLRKETLEETSGTVRTIKEQDLELNFLLEEGNMASIMPRLGKEIRGQLVPQLAILSNSLPEKGKLQYAYMPAEVKKQINDITNFLISNNTSIRDSYRRYLRSVEDLTLLYNGKEDNLEKVKEQAKQDIYNRMGNVIIRGAKEIGILETYKVNNKRLKESREFFERINRRDKPLVMDDQFKDKLLMNKIYNSLRVNGVENDKAIYYCKDISKKLNIHNYNLQEDKYFKLNNNSHEALKIALNLTQIDYEDYQAVFIGEEQKILNKANMSELKEKLIEKFNLTHTNEKNTEILTRAMFIVGYSNQEIRDFYKDHIKVPVDEETLIKIIDNTEEHIKDDEQWGKSSIIYKRDWNNAFDSVFKEKNPEWIYQKDYSSNFHTIAAVDAFLRELWNDLDRSSRQSEREAEMFRSRIMNGRGNLTKAQKKELAKKMKNKGISSEFAIRR